MIEDIGNLSLDLQWLLDERIFSVTVLIFAAWAWWKTKSALAGGAALAAGVLVWTLALSREDLRDSIDDDISNPGSTISEPSEEEGGS